MKKKKKFVRQEPFLGYCPNYIVKIKFLYCKTRFVLQPRWLEGGWFKEGLYCDNRFSIAAYAARKRGKLCCNTLVCIVE